MDHRTDEQLAEDLWNYNHVGMPLEKANIIIVLCSHDIQVADRGAQLFHEGWAPLIVMSGGQGVLTARMFDRSEAELFAARAVDLGVRSDQIWIENRSTNTGENVAFTRNLLAERVQAISKAIAVQKPYMERRTDATFKKVWPEPELIVTSPQIHFHEYKRGFHDAARGQVPAEGPNAAAATTGPTGRGLSSSCSGGGPPRPTGRDSLPTSWRWSRRPGRT